MTDKRKYYRIVTMEQSGFTDFHGWIPVLPISSMGHTEYFGFPAPTLPYGARRRRRLNPSSPNRLALHESSYPSAYQSTRHHEIVCYKELTDEEAYEEAGVLGLNIDPQTHNDLYQRMHKKHEEAREAAEPGQEKDNPDGKE